jgi:hypothetical protein
LRGVAQEPKDPSDVLAVFMKIEEPEDKVTSTADGVSIGRCCRMIIEWLPEIMRADRLGGRQVTARIGGDRLTEIGTVADAVAAMELIAEQGGGTHKTPFGSTDPADLAHFYRFEQHWMVRRMSKKPPPPADRWEYQGELLPRREVYPLAEVPRGGWNLGPGPIRDNLVRCNTAYRQMLLLLQEQWRGPATGDEPVPLAEGALTLMFRLDAAARDLLANQPQPPVYGPEFRIG